MFNFQTDIADGVKGYFIENNRFNTTYISVNFFLPISREKQAERVVLPYILTACSERYNNYIEINKALADLYGSDIYTATIKTGDCACIKIALSTVNDRFSLDGNSPVSEAVDLLMSLIFNPKIKNESFFDENLIIEKRKTVEQILNELNDKRAFASSKIISEMFKNDDYGVGRYGTAEDVEKVNGKELYKAYKNMLKSAYVTVNVIGEKLPDGLFEKIGKCFAGVKRENITDVTSVKKLAENKNVKYVTDRQNITQGKLAMGFSLNTDGFTKSEVEIFNDVFGGGTYSKLFSNVREKMSLCYYCSATKNYLKGYITVNSGIEAPNAEKAENEIINQLNEIKNGNIDDFEIAASVKSTKDTCRKYYDSQSSLDGWYTLRAVNGEFISPLEFAETLDTVTKDAVIKVANNVKLHTVYKLLPQEETK